MAGYVFSGVAIVLCLFSMMARSNLKRWLGYSNLVDIVFTILMIFLFHDTFSGIVSAAIAGVFMSALLTIVRKSIGCERLVFSKRMRWYHVPTLEWRYFAPSELTFYGYKGK